MTVFNTQNNPCDLPKIVNNTKMTLISIRRENCHFQEKKRYSAERIQSEIKLTVNKFTLANIFDKNGRYSIEKSIIFDNRGKL